MYGFDHLISCAPPAELVKVQTFCTQAEVQILLLKNITVKVEVQNQLLYSSKSKNVQALKSSLEDVSVSVQS